MPASTRVGLGLLAGLALSGALAVAVGLFLSVAAGLILLMVLDAALLAGSYVMIRRLTKAGN